jgi:hypothetical protein
MDSITNEFQLHPMWLHVLKEQLEYILTHLIFIDHALSVKHLILEIRSLSHFFKDNRSLTKCMP